MIRAVASNTFTFLVVALFLVGGLVLWGQGQYVANGPLSEAICVQVERGTNMARVSRQLEERGVVTNSRIFRLGADYSEKSDQLKAGSYLVPPAASMSDIVEIVTKGGASTCGTEIVWRVGINRIQVQARALDPATNRYETKVSFLNGDEAPEGFSTLRDAADTRFRIALAEGVTSWQVVEALKAVDVLEGEVPERPAEGTLAPDSYEIARGDKRKEVIARMVASQDRRLETAWAERAEGLPLRSREEALILASIIEKETGVPEERKQVASVFINRLNQGMRLQTDPTVIYGITKGEGTLGRGLRQSELRRETPWNTYVIGGLPPTPIANPGLESIRAALDPDQTKYLFFVADGTGGHAFAETLAEHNKNVAEWRKIEAQRANQ